MRNLGHGLIFRSDNREANVKPVSPLIFWTPGVIVVDRPRMVRVTMVIKVLHLWRFSHPVGLWTVCRYKPGKGSGLLHWPCTSSCPEKWRMGRWAQRSGWTASRSDGTTMGIGACSRTWGWGLVGSGNGRIWWCWCQRQRCIHGLIYICLVWLRAVPAMLQHLSRHY